MRPYFIIPGQEKKDFMQKICQKMDLEAKNCSTFTMDLHGTEIKIIVEWHLGLDGKLIDMSTGLSTYTFVIIIHTIIIIPKNVVFLHSDGAHCTRCPVTMEDAHDPDKVKAGFDDYWDKTKLKEHYASLKKNPDGTIKVTHKGTYLLINSFFSITLPFMTQF